MTELVLHPTSTAQWHALVNEAQQRAQQPLNEALESYLVFMLMRFCQQPDILSRALATEYLDNDCRDGARPQQRLRDVGDLCLLYSGLFPHQAERRRVRISYYVNLGRSAYHRVAAMAETSITELFTGLSREFILLMDILQLMRNLDGRQETLLSPLQAFELWQDTSSEQAKQRLAEVTQATPDYRYTPDQPIH